MPATDVMRIANAHQAGKATLDVHKSFTAQRRGFVSHGQDKVKVADLDLMAPPAFFGNASDGEGFETPTMAFGTAPSRFAMYDADKNSTLNSDEINGRAFQPN